MTRKLEFEDLPDREIVRGGKRGKKQRVKSIPGVAVPTDLVKVEPDPDDGFPSPGAAIRYLVRTVATAHRIDRADMTLHIDEETRMNMMAGCHMSDFYHGPGVNDFRVMGLQTVVHHNLPLMGSVREVRLSMSAVPTMSAIRKPGRLIAVAYESKHGLPAMRFHDTCDEEWLR